MIRAALVLALWPGAATALSLTLPAGAEETFAAAETGAVRLPTGAYRDTGVPVTEYSGHISRQAFRLKGSAETGPLLADLADQLRAAGYTVTASCDTRECGGFDFRFAIDVVQEPAMHVDLGDFRYLAAERPTPEGTAAVSLLVSRAEDAGFVQIVAVEPGEAETPEPERDTVKIAPPEDTPDPAHPFDPGNLVAMLERQGHFVLDDLAFDTGSSDLGEGSYESLRLLADYLRENPGRTVAVVGHTDAVGSLDANIALSRRRAASVRDRLVRSLDVPPSQVTAEGVGFLAPRASNLTEEGREQNRRVEVILTSTG